MSILLLSPELDIVWSLGEPRSCHIQLAVRKTIAPEIYANYFAGLSLYLNNFQYKTQSDRKLQTFKKIISQVNYLFNKFLILIVYQYWTFQQLLFGVFWLKTCIPMLKESKRFNNFCQQTMQTAKRVHKLDHKTTKS